MVYREFIFTIAPENEPCRALPEKSRQTTPPPPRLFRQRQPAIVIL
jgi:hypothetical protein